MMEENRNRRKIAVSGAGGFIGSFLSQWFMEKGFTVLPLHRDLFDSGNQLKLEELINGCYCVINLAGAPILHFWTKSYKEQLLDSRVHTTRSLVDVMLRVPDKPQVFISASAVGYYPAKGCFDEYHLHKGTGFLSTVCGQWEKEALAVSREIRTAITRFGIILAAKGGAFPKMSLTSRFKISTILGSGDQYFPWLSVVDLARAMEFLIDHSYLSGVFNFTTPEQIMYRNFADALKKHYHAIGTVRIPSLLLDMGLGEAADFITQTPCVLPARLQQDGFTYQYPTLQDFLASL
ncbi:MAG: TIGR01777 family oxidoreductase [Tannerellaceae bacterium]|nr:TIGR01777 family oxidoreductase [Tannerellaceae bacterium]